MRATKALILLILSAVLLAQGSSAVADYVEPPACMMASCMGGIGLADGIRIVNESDRNVRIRWRVHPPTGGELMVDVLLAPGEEAKIPYQPESELFLK